MLCFRLLTGFRPESGRYVSRFAWVWAAAAMVAAASGCSGAPRHTLSAEVGPGELQHHLAFLTSPEVGGRVPRSRGSKAVQRYLVDAFEGLGLAPFGDARGFTQKILPGTNVVGVLEGADPQLKDTFVVLSAHYDHLDEGHAGAGVHPGAADNAAGVAVMLEVAEQLALSGRPPARSVVFAAFDAEEAGLLGSALFVQRKDFDPARLAGLVNLDIMGRSTFDVMPRTLVAAGTRRYPRLRAAVTQAGREADVRVLPLGRDLIGPRSDHVWFEGFGKPWVFLTCGPYRDYHKVSDTSDKLDYDALRDQVPMVAEVVRSLADAPEPERPVTTADADSDDAEAAALSALVAAMVADPQAAGLDSHAVDALRGLQPRLAALQRGAGAAGPDSRALVMLDLSAAILPRVMGREVSKDDAADLLGLREVYVAFPEVFMDATRWIMQRVLRHKTRLLSRPKADTKHWVVVDGRSVQRIDLGGGRQRLSVNIPSVTARVSYQWFGGSSWGMQGRWVNLDVTGDAETVAEVLMLRYMASNRNAMPANRVYGPLLSATLGVAVEGGYDAWLAWWLERRGHRDVASWLTAAVVDGPTAVRKQAVGLALRKAGGPGRAAVKRLLLDPRTDPQVRAQIVWHLAGDEREEVTDWLQAVAEDPTPVVRPETDRPAFDRSFVFYDSAGPRFERHLFGARRETTLGELVGDRMRGFIEAR